jgi:hypothetical protein
MRFEESRTFAMAEAAAPEPKQWLEEQVARVGWLPAAHHRHIHQVLARALEAARAVDAQGEVTTRVVGDARTLEVHLQLPAGFGLANEMLLFRRAA